MPPKGRQPKLLVIFSNMIEVYQDEEEVDFDSDIDDSEDESPDDEETPEEE